MDYLEESIKQLKEQNDILIMQVEELKQRNETLLDTNEQLQKELTVRSYTCPCFTRHSDAEGRVDLSEKSKEAVRQAPVKIAHSFNRPAVSTELPQQKGQWAIVAGVLTKTASLKLWKIFLLYLLSQKCWMISRERHSSMTLKDWQQVCWKKLNSMDLEKSLWQIPKR